MAKVPPWKEWDGSGGIYNFAGWCVYTHRRIVDRTHLARNWSTHTDRAMLPLRSLVPVEMDGLLGASKNIGVTSMVQSALRLHGQMTHVGTAVGCVAALALERGKQPREMAGSMALVREVQRRMVRGAGGPGTLLWPYQDLLPDEPYFEAANLLSVAGIWRADKGSVRFSPRTTDDSARGGRFPRAVVSVARRRERLAGS